MRFRAASWAWLVAVSLGLAALHGWTSLLSSAQTKGGAVNLLENLRGRPIGPGNTGGRIVDLAVVESSPNTMYVAAATGGLWKTTDDGKSWTGVFEQQSALCLGAVAVAPSKPDVVWVGTGEANILRSVSMGDGVFKSTNGGKSWSHMGLKESRHIGRIVIHPKNPDVVYVAALGNPWGPSTERGLYKTVDGGKSWQRVLYVDETTGFIDVAIDPSEPDILYAAAYRPQRDAFSGTSPREQFAPGAGLYKTDNGGKTWQRLTEGLPERPIGRAGLAIYRKDPRIVYTVIQTDKTTGFTKGKGGKGGKGGKEPPLEPERGGVFRSEDKGKTWTQLNTLCPLPFFYGQIRIDPNDDQRIYVLGVAFHISSDGGKTFGVGAKGVHVDHHSLWINPKNSDHLVLGNDGGLYVSRDKDKSWTPNRGLPISQFYAIGVDMRKPYRVYGGTQDNGSWGGPSATRNLEGITLADWRQISGADGFYCQVDPTNADLIYCEIQYGGIRRVTLKGGKGGKGATKTIKPAAPKGEPPYRFNWNSPILLSPHNSKTVYFAGNLLFKSVNQGDKWERISPDLTRGEKKGDTGHTITTIAESPLKPGVLYAGTDDGRLHVTRDDGKTWTELTNKIHGLPKDGWFTRVECSTFAEGAAYVSVDRHRNNDVTPYVYKTTDFGATWESVAANLPRRGPVHVVRASSRNPRLLFAGTEFGLYATLDGGKRWQHLKNGIPPALLIHDLVIHPRDRDLVIGSHGRGIFVMDVSALEEMTPRVIGSDVHLCDVRPATAFQLRKSDDPKSQSGYRAANPPFGATIWYYLRSLSAQPVELTILDKDGKKLATLTGNDKAGLHHVVWNLRPSNENGELVAPGEYTVRLTTGTLAATKTLRVEAEGLD
jgi:photosystem II stability/assembly factor-like uncharacterized protein